MEFGRRLLPQVVDQYAQTHASRVYATIPESATDLSNGFRDVTMAKLAAMVNRLSWWLEGILGVGHLDAIAYIGPADIRYAVMFLAAVKCGYKILLVSPRNQISQNQGMVVRARCRALFYSEEMAMFAEELPATLLPGVIMKPVPSLEELLPTPEDTEPYPYKKTFDEARDEPCLILHSSGSTGDPKLVTMTHGTFACTDNDRNVQVPKGRSAQNAAQFNFEGGGKFYSCFPPYHLAGVHAYIDLPIFSTSATVVFGPTKLPPSGYLLSEILKHQHVRAFYVPPTIIEQWAAEHVATEQAKHLEFVLYGGGPLSPHVGEKLNMTTNVCQMYGSLEIGQVQLLVPQKGDWSYMELNPFEEADMQPCGDGTFEMVLHQNHKFAVHRSLWHNFPDVKEWRTGDLFIPHPSKPGLWRFHGRLDDLIVLSSSYKLRPVEMETLIQGNSLLSGALIVGQGRPEPLLIVEPKPNAYQADGIGAQGFIDLIWPTVEKANKIAPSYAKISRSRVLVAETERPFIRAPKGSVVRKLTTNAYAEDINAAYGDETSTYRKPSGVAAVESMSSFLLPGLKEFVRRQIEEHLPSVPISDTDNIFLSGLDSFGAAAISRSLQNGLSQMQSASKNANKMTLRLVYINPTIERLADVILSIITNREIPNDWIGSDANGMELAVKELSSGFPPKQDAHPAPTGKINVALIGPRGSLGPSIVKELLSDPRVGRLYCLNRGNGGKELMRSIFTERNFTCNVDDERLVFMPIDLGKPNLGLSTLHLEEILHSANVIIHNAWRVDFSWTLDLYKATYLRSVRDLVDLSSKSLLRPRIAFVSSVSSVQDWAAVFPDRPVDEVPLESYEVASPLGYGQSKHVAERMLARASEISGTPVTILRVGQVAGPTDPDNGGGVWSTDEWIPSVAAISKTLRLIPDDIPPIDWVPVNLAARSIVELALLGSNVDNGGEDQNSLRVFNVVNPNLSEWSTFAHALQSLLDKEHRNGKGCCRLLPLADWVDALVCTSPKTMSEVEARSSTKILPFFQHLVENAARGVDLHPKFDTAWAVSNSTTMAEMRRIDERLINGWLKQWGL